MVLRLALCPSGSSSRIGPKNTNTGGACEAFVLKVAVEVHKLSNCDVRGCTSTLEIGCDVLHRQLCPWANKESYKTNAWQHCDVKGELG